MAKSAGQITEQTTQPGFRADVLAGLRRQDKTIPCKYLYDERGSALFECITELDEYYLTRTERAIMRTHVHEMAAALGPGCLLIDYGSGNSQKARCLLDHLEEPAGYIPIDVSEEQLLRAAAQLRRDCPDLPVQPVVADFTGDYTLPGIGRPVRRRVVYFPGSTIGNFHPNEAQRFLAHTREVVGLGGAVLLGVDLHKPGAIVEPAYNDADGVTAAFNLNLLQRINRELGADFDLEWFTHEAPFNPARDRIEMHLVSLQDQWARIGEERFQFRAGERILTECSYKYRLDDFADLTCATGFVVEHAWTDAQQLVSVQLLVTATQDPHLQRSICLPR